MDLTKDQLTYRDQKNREAVWYQANQELKELKIKENDLSKHNVADDAWLDERYTQLCEQIGIKPWMV